MTEQTQALIDRIIARLIARADRPHVPGWNGLLLTPDEIRDVLIQELS